LQSLYSIDDELVDAVFLCDIDEVRALLQRGANPDARDEEHRTLIMNATQSGHREILRVLLEAGADPNLRDADQWTPLDVAVYRKAFDMVWQLVQFGADVNAQDDMGISVLLRAVLASNGSTEIVDLLQRRGARSALPKSSGVAAIVRSFGISLDRSGQIGID
jgi:uncharacterized protein